MPRYLRFVRGLVDSSDLPLRMQFGNCLKEAPGEDFANKEQVAKLFRFNSTDASGESEQTSLDDYVARMKPGQEKLYYPTADTLAAARNSRHLEGKSFVSVAKGDLDLAGIGLDDESKKAEQEEKEKKAADSEGLIKRIKTVLEGDTSDVRASTRLTSSPACVVLGEHEMALHMQQLLKQAGHEVPDSKPVLEVNPSHPILELLDQEQDEERFTNWSRLLLDQALLADGGQLEDGAGFVKRMNEMFVALNAR